MEHILSRFVESLAHGWAEIHRCSVTRILVTLRRAAHRCGINWFAFRDAHRAIVVAGTLSNHENVDVRLVLGRDPPRKGMLVDHLRENW